MPNKETEEFVSAKLVLWICSSIGFTTSGMSIMMAVDKPSTMEAPQPDLVHVRIENTIHQHPVALTSLFRQIYLKAGEHHLKTRI